MFNPTRDQVRRFFCDTWAKYQQGHRLEGAEIPAAELCQRHPEYHALLAHPERALEQEWSPETGQMNPFLHLSLHLAIGEQVAINHPPGIREAYQQLSQKMDVHDAEHILLECLGETIWKAQRNGSQMDAEDYVERIRTAAGLPDPV